MMKHLGRKRETSIESNKQTERKEISNAKSIQSFHHPQKRRRGIISGLKL
jgi:hypothetical protein